MSTRSEGRETLDDWVPEEDRSEFFRFEQSLGRLEQDPVCRRAASTLFWQLYYGLDQVQDKVTVLNRVHEVYRAGRDNFRERIAQKQDDPLADAAFVQLHLVTILLRAIAGHIWGNPELVDDLVNVGKNAFAVLPYNEYAGALISARHLCDVLYDKGVDIRSVFSPVPGAIVQPDPPVFEQRRQSLSAVAALLYSEASRRDRESNLHEMALRDFSIAACLWAASVSSMKGELALTEAADSFERLWMTKSSVSDWDEVAESCRLIGENLDTESEDLQPDIEIRDTTGFPWEAITYWEHAATAAHVEMTPPAFKMVLEKTRETMYAERLERDFFEDAWPQLEERTRRALVSMEMAWYDAPKQGGRTVAAVNELRHAFQCELNSLLSGSLRKAMDVILNEQRLRKQLELSAKPSTRSLGLRDVAILLEDAGRKNSTSTLSLRQSIADLHLPAVDRSFLVERLPPYLRRLAMTRNEPEHGIERGQLLRQIGQLRREALGIGEASYLRRLVEIKTLVGSKTAG